MLEKKYICTVCSEKFAHKKERAEHMMITHKLYQYICEKGKQKKRYYQFD
jgi:hypothetical protein